MSSNPNATNTSDLPSFTAIKAHERRAVMLRGQGKKPGQIAAHINDEFALDYSEVTVREWFGVNGRLEQAYMEYLEADAAMALKEARQQIKRATREATDKLISHMRSKDPRVSLDATKALLNKYLPDKQLVMDKPEEDVELPEELQAVAKSLKEGADGSQPVDEPQVGQPDNPPAGA